MAQPSCARIENDHVVQVIVCGDAAWAAEHLGGEWIFTGERLVGIGWPVVNGEIVEPPAPDSLPHPQPYTP